MYWDLFDMKQRELDEFAEVFAKETEQKNGIKSITRRCCNCDHSELGNSLWYCFETGRFMSPNGWCESWGGGEEMMSDYLPQDLYVLKIGKAYVYPYGDQHPHIKDGLDTSVMAGKERIEKLQERFGGAIFRVYIKELEDENAKD